MQIKSFVAGAAIALAATIGSASAAERFTTLEGIPGTTLTKQEMATVTGTKGSYFFIIYNVKTTGNNKNNGTFRWKHSTSDVAGTNWRICEIDGGCDLSMITFDGAFIDTLKITDGFGAETYVCDKRCNITPPDNVL